MNIKFEAIILQLPEKVFPWVADPEKAMKWQKNVKGGEIIKNDPNIIGTTFKEIIEEDGKTLEMFGKITKYEKEKVIGFHIESKIHAFDVSYLLKGTGETTKFVIEVVIQWKFPMNVVSLFIGGKIAERITGELKAEVDELKRFCEGTQEQ